MRDARDPDDVLRIIARALARDFGRSCTAYEVRNGRLRVVAAADDATASPLGEDDVDLDDLRHRGVVHHGPGDLVAVAFDGQLHAVLALGASGAALDDDDVKHLRALAAYASLALSTARAFEALRRSAAEGAALTDAARTILGFNELEPLAEALCGLGVRLALATRAVFYARRGERLERIAGAVVASDADLPESLPLDEAAARHELAGTLGADAFVASRMSLRVDEEGSEYFAFFVLVRPLPFGRSDQRLCEALVTLAALALRNVELYEQSTRAYRALSESNAFKDDLMAMFAHDFKGPLTVISGFAELSLETNDEALRRNAQTILEQTRRLAKLSDDALALAATQSAGFSLQRTCGDVTEFVRTCIAPLDRDGRIIIVAPAQAQPAAFDRMRLRHVLENVIGNALKYSAEAVRVEVAGSDDEVRIDVADNGIGVPAADMERIFSRFGRGANARSRGVAGSGVGLYIAKKIVEVHGGRLEVRSTENEGSTFSIVLPRA
ncbi:MAG: HAMP domain-containing histidine kinase [Candidatus Eremiobacteraeota bacterium]|nr:HAMP domain-containing histidine kinase [Candidatus Eremiobacteraeota bacterium]